MLHGHGLDIDTVLKGHTGFVHRFAWSADGNFLAAPGDDSSVIIWNTIDGKIIHRLRTGTPLNYCVAWSPNGRFLATGARQIRVWDVEHGTVVYTLNDHKTFVYAADWSPTGRYLATAGGDRSLIVWNAPLFETNIRQDFKYKINALSWSPKGKWLALVSDNGSLQVLTETLSTAWKLDLKNSGRSMAVAWSPDGKTIAVGCGNRTVRIVSVLSEKQVRLLEGYISEVQALNFSRDGLLLASETNDGTVRLWRTDTWDIVADIQLSPAKSTWTDLGFHPTQAKLAIRISDYDIQILNYNIDQFFSEEPHARTVHYMCAKIVLVGNSDVGKSCLAMRLKEDRYEEMESTHGMKCWRIPSEKLSPTATPAPGQKRDIVLWDLGGQGEYRLVHQLFLQDTNIALFLLDATRGQDTFEQVEDWSKRLEQVSGAVPTIKLLIGSKMDDENSEIDDFRIQHLVRKCGFKKFLSVSAKTGRGISKLREAISEEIDWDNIAMTSRDEFFQRILDEIEDRRSNGEVVLYCKDLETAIECELGHCDSDAIATVVQQLAMQGILVETCLESGDRALVLQVEQVERYAGSIILAAQNNPRGVPTIDDGSLISPHMIFPKIGNDARLPRSQEIIVLQCVVQLLLQHGVCLRHAGLLIFPSLFRPTHSDETSLRPQAESLYSLYYDVSGAVDNIYASLVACLALSEQFGPMRLWEYRAEFGITGEGEFGICKSDRGRGFARLDVYTGSRTTNRQRQLYLDFVDNHVRENGVDIQDHLALTCSACNYVFQEDDLRQRVLNGYQDVSCMHCNARYKLGDAFQQHVDRDADRAFDQTRALRIKIEEKRDEIVKQARQQFQTEKADEVNTGPIRILHLSDLHFTESDDPADHLQPLLADLNDSQEGFGLSEVDFLVISGDFSDRAKPEEFRRCQDFVLELIDEMNLNSDRCIFVPGNHDIDWETNAYHWMPERQWNSMGLSHDLCPKQGDGYLVRVDAEYPNRLRNFSRDFYHPVIQQEYPLDADEQCIPLLFPEQRIQFLAINSCWELDEYYRERASVKETALSRGLVAAKKQIADARKQGLIQPDDKLLRMAVWHYPVTGDEHMLDDGFLDRLRKDDFCLCMHGHVHEIRAELLGYLHPTRRLHVVGAGSFGSVPDQRPPSTPRLYNLIEYHHDLDQIKVHSRCRLREAGSWSPWNFYPGKGGGTSPFYNIDLANGKTC